MYEGKMKDIWRVKLKLARRIPEEEWTLFQKLNRSQNEWEHIFSIKYASGIMPTKVNMVQRKHGEDQRCLCCDNDENTEHILQCKSLTQSEVFEKEKIRLHDYLINVTSWEIKGALIELIKSFRNQREPSIHHNWSNNVAKMTRLQYGMGQQSFLSGLWIQQWVMEQGEYHKTLKTKKR